MISIFSKLSPSFIRNNIQSVLFLLTFLSLNGLLFLGRSLNYYDFGVYLMLARACGQCLNFTCTFVVVCVLRRSITFLRSVGFSEYLPLDHHIYYHKFTGWMIVFYGVVHTVAHVINFKICSKITTIPWFDFLFKTYLGIGWIAGAACLTGWILIVILIVMMIPAQPFMRRSGQFEVFYYTHFLYVAFFIILFIHAPNFWIWFIAPGTILMVEALIRITRAFVADHGLTYIEQGVILPSRVIQLIIKRPAHFEYRPGDYVFVKIPEITKYEWHPLTISSAPEQADVIWLHIRAVGEWTNRLYDYFSEQEKKATKRDINKKLRSKKREVKEEKYSKLADGEKSNATGMNVRVMVLPVPDDCNEFGCGPYAVREKHKFDIEMAHSPVSKYSYSTTRSTPSAISSEMTANNVINLNKPLKVRLDGPYGTPSSRIFHAQHAVLIATGIGVTPFASILQSIMFRYIEAKRTCPSCSHCWSDGIPANVMKLRKVDFLWINRDQKSFEWFVSLLSELEQQQKEVQDEDRFLDIHMYITSSENQANSASDFDFSHGLKLNYGRPKWKSFFKTLSQVQKGRIITFFCGRPDLAKYLRTLCNGFGIQFRKEVF